MHKEKNMKVNHNSNLPHIITRLPMTHLPTPLLLPSLSIFSSSSSDDSVSSSGSTSQPGLEAKNTSRVAAVGACMPLIIAPVAVSITGIRVC